MSTVLTNGIIIPENGSRNWGGDLANNWNIIDVNVGYMTDVKNRVTTLENSVAENSSNIEINTSNISALQTSKQDTIEDLETIRSGASAGATAVQPSALNNYVDLSSEQTIGGTKTFTSQIVGSIEKSEKDLNGNIITSTYATKSELANKANNSDVVHKSESEVITGRKTFTDGFYSKFIEFTQNSGETHGGFIDFHYAGSTKDYTSRIIESDEGKLYVNGCFFRSNSVSPGSNNCNLGTSSNKWKTLNGINPGALSLPDYTQSVTLSFAINSPIEIPFDGFIQITLNVSNYSYMKISVNDAGVYADQSSTLQTLAALIPVSQNDVVKIQVVDGEYTGFGGVVLFKNKGNV